ncbi:MAG TPA: hypothetical protein ACQGQH_08245 [Xylella sp.]
MSCRYVPFFAGVAQLVEQRIRNRDAVVVAAEAEGMRYKALGLPAVRW